MKKISKYLLILSLLFFVSCGKGDDSDSSKTDEESTEDVTNDDKTTSGKTEGKDDESSLGTNDLGMSEGLPDDFPDDIPEPENGKCLGSIITSEGTVVTFESTDKVKEVVDFYKEKMSNGGYELSEGGEILVSDQGGLIGWEKAGKEIGLMLGYDKEKEITSVVITYNFK
ncbi:MAG: hypothetical protein H8D45_29340 [Bacteroidetes bacterium]|nr:hypothetical protein [Bacteroidota bacterium]